MTERELVRCACGLVRNDEDAPAPLALAAWLDTGQGSAVFRSVPELDTHEGPRLCRGCSCLYMLPRPQAPQQP